MPLAIGHTFPSLDGATSWSTGSQKSSPSNNPVLVQFWAISCPICKANAPRLLHLIQTYSTRGLQLMSIHMPRTEADTDEEKVKVAIDEIGLIGPCAIDNQHILGGLFQTGNVWPCYFLFDAKGKLRSRAAGALGLKMAENSLKRMFEPETAWVEPQKVKT